MEILTGSEEATKKEEERLAKAFSKRASVSVTLLPKPVTENKEIPAWKKRQEEDRKKKEELLKLEAEARKQKVGAVGNAQPPSEIVKVSPNEPVNRERSRTDLRPPPVDQTSSSFSDFKDWSSLEERNRKKYQEESDQFRNSQRELMRTRRSTVVYQGGSPLGSISTPKKPKEEPVDSTEKLKGLLSGLRKTGSSATLTSSTSSSDISSMASSGTSNDSDKDQPANALRRSNSVTSFVGLYGRASGYSLPKSNPNPTSFNQPTLAPTWQPTKPSITTNNTNNVQPFSSIYKEMLKQAENELIEEEKRKGSQPTKEIRRVDSANTTVSTANGNSTSKTSNEPVSTENKEVVVEVTEKVTISQA